MKRTLKQFRFPIFAKLLVAFMILLLLLAIVSMISIKQINRVDQDYANLLKRRQLVIENVLKLKTEAITQENAVRGLLIDRSNKENLEAYHQSLEDFQYALKEFAQTAPNESARKQIQDLEEAYLEYQLLLDNIVQQYQTNPNQALQMAQSRELEIAKMTFHEHADGILEVANQVMAQDQNVATDTISFVIRMLMVATIMTLILGFVMSLIISRTISKSIYNVSHAIETLANGNFAIELLKVKNRDEIGDLVSSMNKMIHDLRQILSAISKTDHYISSLTSELLASSEENISAANQVASISEKSANGSEKQLQTFKETVNKIQEINHRIVNISHLSEDMLEATGDTRVLTADGAQLVQHVVDYMNDIHVSTEQSTKTIKELEEHSKHIGEIIAFITSLAEQTNLLALNAAIEAARAGEHGKGFAVVAEEVRKLAEESSESAGKVIEIVSYIQEGIQQTAHAMNCQNQMVTEALAHSERTKDSFMSIESSIRIMNEQVRKVSSSVENIKDYSQQINREMMDVQYIAEEGLHLSHDISAASEQQLAVTKEVTAMVQQLADLAEDMEKQLSRFKF